MPYYDYQCVNNHRFELKQSFSAEPVTTCPTCEATAKRLISVVPIHFKGSGFYVNDYARKQPASGESKGGDTSASESGKAETPKAETKPGPKEDSKPGPKSEAKAAPKAAASSKE